MKGIRIKYNGGEKIIGQSIPEEVVTFILSIRKDDENFRIDVGAFNPIEDFHSDWIKDVVKSNSSIELIFLDSVDQNEISAPANVRKGNSKEFVKAEKVKYFHRLKEELEMDGLI